METNEHIIVLYDGACRMCVGFTGWLARLDGHKTFKLLPFQDEAVRKRFPQLTEVQYQHAIHVITAENKVLRGADAVLEIWRQLRLFTSPLVYVLRLPPFIWIARLVYMLIAKYRKRIY